MFIQNLSKNTLKTGLYFNQGYYTIHLALCTINTISVVYNTYEKRHHLPHSQ